MSEPGPVLIGLDWSSGQPRWRLRPRPEDAATIVPLDDRELAYRVPDAPRHWCLGHLHRTLEGSRQIDCLAIVRPPDRRCFRCRGAEALEAGRLHHAHHRELRDPVMDAHLGHPNVLYLAGFADGSTKIGTSRRSRIHVRLLEQGAWLATVLGTVPDGYQVRVLEDMVTETLGLPQSVSVARKLAGLADPLPREMLGAAHDDWRRRLVPLLDHHEGFERLDEPWHQPWRPELERRRLIPYPADTTTGAHDLHLLGAIGRIGLATRSGGDDLFGLDLGPLFGLELDWGHHGSAALVIQDRLF